MGVARERERGGERESPPPDPLQMGDANKTIKLVVIGDGAVGKTCLLMVYATNKFPTDYVPTVFVNYQTVVPVNGENVDLELIDTAGQEIYDNLRCLSYNDTDVFLICYGCDTMTSLNNVTHKWKPELVKEADRHKNPPIILVGTKMDMDKEVQLADARDVAKKIGAVDVFECSAKTGVGILDVFQEAVKVAFEKKYANAIAPPPQASGGGCCVML